MRKIFVGNLSWKATEEELRSLFESVGVVVSVKIVTDQMTGRSKGFAFVEMQDADAAQAAIDKLNNAPFQERNLRISLAQERAERPPREGGSSGYSSREGSSGGYRGGSSSEGGFRGGADRRGGGDFRSSGPSSRSGGFRGSSSR
jgi:RNA recognition motif-containing protein